MSSPGELSDDFSPGRPLNATMEDPRWEPSRAQSAMMTTAGLSHWVLSWLLPEWIVRTGTGNAKWEGPQTSPSNNGGILSMRASLSEGLHKKQCSFKCVSCGFSNSVSLPHIHMKVRLYLSFIVINTHIQNMLHQARNNDAKNEYRRNHTNN